MATVFNKEEAKKWRDAEDGGEFRILVAESLNQLAGDLGGQGICLVDEDGNSLKACVEDHHETL